MRHNEHNPFAIEEHFDLRLRDIYLRSKSPAELALAHSALIGEIETNLSLAHVERDEAAISAWTGAREYVAGKIS